MDKILYHTLLIDFYGELLTKKQKETFETYFFDNLSLSEVGEMNNVSRQSVNDLLRRTEEILIDYEKKLKLVENYLTQKNKKEIILEYIDNKLIHNENLDLLKLREMIRDITE